MSGFMREMAQSSLERLTQARKLETEQALWLRASETPPAPRLQLSDHGFDCIAELKLRSPAAGVLSTANEDLAARVTAYAQGGAAAVSVLTEPYRFDGSMAHLARASQVLAPLGVATMRKDFLIDPYQVMEARALGASGVLVILRMLDHGRVVELLDCAAMLHMFVLLEAFDEQDIECANQLVTERAQRVEQLLVGINSRDLDTLTWVFIVSTLAFAALTRTSLHIGYAFFVWAGLFGVALVGHFWAFAADTFNLKSGQRLFPLIMMGGSLGAIAGAQAAKWSAEALTPTGLLLLAAGMLAATLAMPAAAHGAVPAGSRSTPLEPHEKPVPRILGGFSTVFHDRYLNLRGYGKPS